MACILLLGLESDLAEQLTDVLTAQQHHVRIAETVDEVVRFGLAEIVFCSGDAPGYRQVVRELSTGASHMAVVVVSRFPENRRWLEALDLGAADYCGAPFEPALMRWLVDSVMRRPRAAAA